MQHPRLIQILIFTGRSLRLLPGVFFPDVSSAVVGRPRVGADIVAAPVYFLRNLDSQTGVVADLIVDCLICDPAGIDGQPVSRCPLRGIEQFRLLPQH